MLRKRRRGGCKVRRCTGNRRPPILLSQATEEPPDPGEETRPSKIMDSSVSLPAFRGSSSSAASTSAPTPVASASHAARYPVVSQPVEEVLLSRVAGGIYTGGVDHRGLPHGLGMLAMASGEEYLGAFTHGERHGFGEARYADGAVPGGRYAGSFDANAKSGAGCWTWSDGEQSRSRSLNGVRHCGLWSSNAPDGCGVRTSGAATASDVAVWRVNERFSPGPEGSPGWSECLAAVRFAEDAAHRASVFASEARSLTRALQGATSPGGPRPRCISDWHTCSHRSPGDDTLAVDRLVVPGAGYQSAVGRRGMQLLPSAAEVVVAITIVASVALPYAMVQSRGSGGSLQGSHNGGRGSAMRRRRMGARSGPPGRPMVTSPPHPAGEGVWAELRLMVVAAWRGLPAALLAGGRTVIAGVRAGVGGSGEPAVQSSPDPSADLIFPDIAETDANDLEVSAPPSLTLGGGIPTLRPRRTAPLEVGGYFAASVAAPEPPAPEASTSQPAATARPLRGRKARRAAMAARGRRPEITPAPVVEDPSRILRDDDAPAPSEPSPSPRPLLPLREPDPPASPKHAVDAPSSPESTSTPKPSPPAASSPPSAPVSLPARQTATARPLPSLADSAAAPSSAAPPHKSAVAADSHLAPPAASVAIGGTSPRSSGTRYVTGHCRRARRQQRSSVPPGWNPIELGQDGPAAAPPAPTPRPPRHMAPPVADARSIGVPPSPRGETGSRAMAASPSVSAGAPCSGTVGDHTPGRESDGDRSAGGTTARTTVIRRLDQSNSGGCVGEASEWLRLRTPPTGEGTTGREDTGRPRPGGILPSTHTSASKLPGRPSLPSLHDALGSSSHHGVWASPSARAPGSGSIPPLLLSGIPTSLATPLPDPIPPPPPPPPRNQLTPRGSEASGGRYLPHGDVGPCTSDWEHGWRAAGVGRACPAPQGVAASLAHSPTPSRGQMAAWGSAIWWPPPPPSAGPPPPPRPPPPPPPRSTGAATAKHVRTSSAFAGGEGAGWWATPGAMGGGAPEAGWSGDQRGPASGGRASGTGDRGGVGEDAESWYGWTGAAAGNRLSRAAGSATPPLSPPESRTAVPWPSPRVSPRPSDALVVGEVRVDFSSSGSSRAE